MLQRSSWHRQATGETKRDKDGAVKEKKLAYFVAKTRKNDSASPSSSSPSSLIRLGEGKQFVISKLLLMFKPEDWFRL